MNKTLFALILSVFFFSSIQSVEAQVAGKFKFAGVNVYGDFSEYTLGFGVEVPLSGQWSFQGNFDITTSNSAIFTLKPEVKYFFIGSPIQGFYLGGVTGIGFGDFNGVIIPLAPQVGYQHLFLDDKLSLEGDLEVGGFLGIGNNLNSDFYLGFGATIGYVF